VRSVNENDPMPSGRFCWRQPHPLGAARDLFVDSVVLDNIEQALRLLVDAAFAHRCARRFLFMLTQNC